MPKISWEDQFVYYLIEKVHKEEYIWNSKNVFYKNKLKKQQFWFRMAEEMNKEFNPATDFTYGEVLKKWNNLKSYFTKETQKLYTAQKSGASVEEVENIRSSWKFKPSLGFLSATATPTNIFSDVSENLSESSTPAKEITMTESLAIKGDGSALSPVRPNSSHNENVFDETIETSSDISLAESLSDSTQSFHIGIFSQSPSTSRSHDDTTPAGGFSSNTGHVEKKPRTVKTSRNESLGSSLLEATKGLTEVIATKTKSHAIATENSAFGTCISAEIDKLEPDLQITAKKTIFSIIMDLQSEQIKRNTK